MSTEEIDSEIWRFQNLYNIKNSLKNLEIIPIETHLMPEIECIFPTFATTSLLSLNTNMIWGPVERLNT